MMTASTRRVDWLRAWQWGGIGALLGCVAGPVVIACVADLDALGGKTCMAGAIAVMAVVANGSAAGAPAGALVGSFMAAGRAIRIGLLGALLAVATFAIGLVVGFEVGGDPQAGGALGATLGAIIGAVTASLGMPPLVGWLRRPLPTGARPPVR